MDAGLFWQYGHDYELWQRLHGGFYPTRYYIGFKDVDVQIEVQDS